ncbi:HD domain-containing protein [Acetobacterium sp. KB-1]|jgi:diguanylate cyclase (GGDEF)-like protein/putative nucleotidyltransferase with HDIG domain|uniref:HD domain-containing protein n=1 Tax=Acetobacterium sp. KB-1 TaxID=2184575 RepID=UPI000DBEB3D2|nr:HD domain-containing protein [Acetobacterium sp. KB-1]AWW27651.1 diguanylate cyclase [Acetobacterium sp. KB-1]
MADKRSKFLAVDDNQDNLITLRALIREAFPEAQVLTATSGMEGIMIAAQEDPDVIILDVVMPGMDGFEVCQKLKAEKSTKEIPVVFVTAVKGDREHRILALESGAEAFLAKPIDESELTAQIRAMVKIKTANRHKQDEQGRLARMVAEKTAELEKAHSQTIELLESLKVSEEKNRRLITQMEQGLIVHEVLLDEDGEPEDCRILYVNESFERLTSLKSQDILEKTLTEIIPESKAFMVSKCAQVIKTGASVCFEKYFHQFNKYFEMVAYCPEPQQVAVIISDISKRKQTEERIRYLSDHDYLTGVFNRRYYEEALVTIDTEDNLPLSLVISDVNGLKLVNESFGHALGDELLKKVAEVILNECRDQDVVARLSGDEFIILLPKTDQIQTARIVKRMRTAARQESIGAIKFSISFGYETKTEANKNIQDVLKNAEDNMYRHKLYESTSIKNKTIDLIMNTLYEKSSREMLHSKRVSEICEKIALKMNFDPDDVSQVKTAGLIHDIGKMGIDEKILNKPGGLDPDEWKKIQRHPEIGYRILSSSSEFSELARYVLEHQERWDGKGYPKRLAGEEISVQARIIGVADAFDAMTCDRAYRKGLSVEEAVAEIRKCAGTQFDPQVASVFIEKVLTQS